MKRLIVDIERPDRTRPELECGHSNPSDHQTSGTVDCQPCDRREMPSTTRPGRQTPVFDSTSVPAALLGAHQTNAWAELVVLEGRVSFYDEEPIWTSTATPEHSVVIVPRRPHRINPGPKARFYVQFHDLPRALKKTQKGASS